MTTNPVPYPPRQVTNATEATPFLISKFPHYFGAYVPRRFWITKFVKSGRERLVAQLWCNATNQWTQPKTVLSASIVLVHQITNPMDTQKGLLTLTPLYLHEQDATGPHQNPPSSQQEIRAVAENENNVFTDAQKKLIKNALATLYADVDDILWSSVPYPNAVTPAPIPSPHVSNQTHPSLLATIPIQPMQPKTLSELGVSQHVQDIMREGQERREALALAKKLAEEQSQPQSQPPATVIANTSHSTFFDTGEANLLSTNIDTHTNTPPTHFAHKPIIPVGQSSLQDILIYNHLHGTFFDKQQNTFVSTVGHYTPNIGVGTKAYRWSEVVYLIMTGELPVGGWENVIFQDGNRHNLAWGNLLDQSQPLHNHPNIHYSPRMERYRITVQYDGKYNSLFFKTIEQAKSELALYTSAFSL